MLGSVIGERVLRLRLAGGLSQGDVAVRSGFSTATISKLENGRGVFSEETLTSLASVLGCTPDYLINDLPIIAASRPWLRAYADASKRTLDQYMAQSEVAASAILADGLKPLPDRIPQFFGDVTDDFAVEEFADATREAAGISQGGVVGNAMRAAERLGCVVLPMQEELGRHLGVSFRVDLLPMMCIGRSSSSGGEAIPGDRQRFTIAHELGHLALHSGRRPPATAQEANEIERQAHLFAGNFLAPSEAMHEEIEAYAGRVTIRTLTDIKSRWGISIRALIMRFQAMGVIGADQARSLHKQISARGMATKEPVEVATESALWLRKSIDRAHVDGDEGFAASVGISVSFVKGWTNWSYPASAPVYSLADARRKSLGSVAT